MSEPTETPSLPTAGFKLTMEVSEQTAQSAIDAWNDYDRRDYDAALHHADKDAAFQDFIRGTLGGLMPHLATLLFKKRGVWPISGLGSPEGGTPAPEGGTPAPEPGLPLRAKVFSALFAFAMSPRQALALLDDYDRWCNQGEQAPSADGEAPGAGDLRMERVADALRMIGASVSDVRAILVAIIEQHGGERWGGPMANPEPTPEGGAS